MRCPKCGHDNPADTLFCEECDWRLDQKYTGEKKRNPLMFSLVSLILGIIAVVCGISVQPAVGVCAGIIGMVISGYSVNIPRYIECNKNLCIAMAGIGIVLNIIGFLFGLGSM